MNCNGKTVPLPKQCTRLTRFITCSEWTVCSHKKVLGRQLQAVWSVLQYILPGRHNANACGVTLAVVIVVKVQF